MPSDKCDFSLTFSLVSCIAFFSYIYMQLLFLRTSFFSHQNKVRKIQDTNEIERLSRIFSDSDLINDTLLICYQSIIQ